MVADHAGRALLQRQFDACPTLQMGFDDAEDELVAGAGCAHASPRRLAGVERMDEVLDGSQCGAGWGRLRRRRELELVAPCRRPTR